MPSNLSATRFLKLGLTKLVAERARTFRWFSESPFLKCVVIAVLSPMHLYAELSVNLFGRRTYGLLGVMLNRLASVFRPLVGLMHAQVRPPNRWKKWLRCMLTDVGRITLGAYGLRETRLLPRVVRTLWLDSSTRTSSPVSMRTVYGVIS